MNNNKNKFFLKILLTLLITATFNLLAYSSDENANEKETNKTEKKQKAERKQKKFIPSEKINADSSVSFPVDI